ncbi:hypothetical protein N7478_000857 [Penicillium angulare]|uniref:uncharacterized protein n=1 Tax=Penicillium angulare TaxID=116970 RepID=UPI00254211B7|nr:uncharacterized protein N7478_000857 [Penicillium angulare]KAJ5291606.1 hypothetical protein N7478_000857 [Penicillium angulare]
MGSKSDIVDNNKIDTTALNLAIDTVSVNKLREVLKFICEANPGAKEQASKKLIVKDTEVKNGKPALKSGHIANQDNRLQPDPMTPFLHKPEKIEAAKAAYERENEMRGPYNPDVLFEGVTEEPQADDNSSLFDDDDDPEATAQEEWVKEEWPQYFIFGCCEGNLRDNLEGCIVDWHVNSSSIPPAKRTRVM